MKTREHTATRFSGYLRTILASKYFFITVVVLFIVQMAWIALSSSYPMLFDEEYHLGIIDIYSRQLSPFITSQPPDAAFHGDITRYSSYFFHYLMSFPYRVISLFTHDIMTKVIIMRFLCIGLVVVGVWFFRKVLLEFKLSKATTHTAIFIFTLIPIVPFALSQINYDALIFVFIPLLIYLSQKATNTTNRQAWYAALFGIISGFAAVTKFTVLPIILGCFIFIATCLYRQHHKKLAKVLFAQLRLISRPQCIVMSILLVISMGLVAERYAVNLVTYGSIEPKCDELHASDECSQYTVYRRDKGLRQSYQSTPHNLMNPIQYSENYWVPHIFDDFFVTGTYVNQTPTAVTNLRTLPTTLSANAGNPLLRISAWALFGVSIVVILVAGVKRKLVPARMFYLFGIIFVIYSLASWLKNYGDYLNLGSPVAAQGRYYVWFLIPVLAMVAVAVKQLIKDVRVYALIVLISLVLLTQGGGVGSYILYSNPKWYWFRDHHVIEQANNTARQILQPPIIRR
jgi:hypothetical protein